MVLAPERGSAEVESTEYTRLALDAPPAIGPMTWPGDFIAKLVALGKAGWQVCGQEEAPSGAVIGRVPTDVHRTPVLVLKRQRTA
jgi:hypothetical protein